jgi:hypothetical protein
MLRGTSAKSVFDVVKWIKEYRAVTEVLVKIEMPGVDKNSLEVRVEGDVLKVDGKLDFSKYRSLQPLYTESLGVRPAKARCMTCASLKMNSRRRRFANSDQLRHQASASHGSDSEPSVNPRLAGDGSPRWARRSRIRGLAALRCMSFDAVPRSVGIRRANCPR